MRFNGINISIWYECVSGRHVAPIRQYAPNIQLTGYALGIDLRSVIIVIIIKP